MLELDRANRVLVRELGEDLADHRVHLALVVAEVVEERAQRRMGDLELRRRELEVVVERHRGAVVGGIGAHSAGQCYGGRWPRKPARARGAKAARARGALATICAWWEPGPGWGSVSSCW